MRSSHIGMGMLVLLVVFLVVMQTFTAVALVGMNKDVDASIDLMRNAQADIGMMGSELYGVESELRKVWLVLDAQTEMLRADDIAPVVFSPDIGDDEAIVMWRRCVGRHVGSGGFLHEEKLLKIDELLRDLEWKMDVVGVVGLMGEFLECWTVVEEDMLLLE